MDVRSCFKEFIQTLGIFIITLGIRFYGLKIYFAFEQQIIDVTSNYFADLIWFALKIGLGVVVFVYLIYTFTSFKRLWKSI